MKILHHGNQQSRPLLKLLKLVKRKASEASEAREAVKLREGYE